MLSNIQTKHVWLCDDDEEDHFFFEQGLKEVSPTVQLTSFYNCHELLLHLHNTRPDLLFLDLNLPMLSGMECLKSIREQRSLKRLPVIMYTSSNYFIDVHASYGFGATLHVVKPVHHGALVEQLKQLFELDWNSLETITEQQFTGSRYRVFGAG